MYSITLNTPITGSGDFNKLWLHSLNINANPVNGKVTAVAVVKPYNGSAILDVPKTLFIKDVLDLASKDETFAGVINSLLAEVDRQLKLNKLN